MDELVARLAKGDHPVVASYSSVTERREAVGRGYVHLKFTDTRGGIELGFLLDEDACDLSNADFDKGSGTIHLVGGLSLNGVKVSHISDLDIASMEGAGHLELKE